MRVSPCCNALCSRDEKGIYKCDICGKFFIYSILQDKYTELFKEKDSMIHEGRRIKFCPKCHSLLPEESLENSTWYKCKKCSNAIPPDEALDNPMELIDHPQHYKGKGIEAIDVIEAFLLDFNLGNALKYILRCNKKGSKKQDIQKAIWYLQREIADGK